MISVNLESKKRGHAIVRAVRYCTVCALFLVLQTHLDAADTGAFSALFRSQRLVAAKDLDALDKGEPNVTLNGTQLFNPSDPVRVIRDTSLTPSADGPCVEMTNGDVLPGRLIRYVESGQEAGLPAHFVIELTHDPQTIQTKKPNIRIRADAVKRIAAQGQLRRPFDPGLIELIDGRRTRTESVRWTSAGLKALTPEGVFSSRLDQLHSVDLPGKNIVAGVVSDAKWQFIYPDDCLLRIHTTNGSQLTFPRRMVTRDVERVRRRRFRYDVKQVEQIAVQPAWALEAIPVPRDSIVLRSYREYNEVPLSLLPVVSQNSESGLHYWPWRRNQGVKGSTLRSGDIAVDLGIGMHSHSELTFLLPDSATEFSSLLGMDYGVGNRGCVQCRLHAENTNTQALWTSGFLRGEDGIKSIGPLSLRGIKHLSLVTDFGHKDRPAGADPYDVRDQVAWLLPTVKIDTSKLLQPSDLQVWLPKLEGWTLSEDAFKHLKLVPVWNREAGRWETAMGLEANGESSFRISRRFRVSAKNAWLPIAARRDGANRAKGELVRVEVNGTPHSSSMNGDLNTEHAYKNADSRVWMLGQFLGQEIRLDVVVESLSNWSTGVIWDDVSPHPIITGLGPRDAPFVPDVPLVSLQPVKHNLKGTPILESGKLTSGDPLAVRSLPFERGFGVPVGTELTYDLNPQWGRFVAVIGLADGWKGAGPYRILLDGEVYWTSELSSYGRNDPGAQIDLSIPPGHKTITLNVLGSESFGAWANSGFMLR